MGFIKRRKEVRALAEAKFTLAWTSSLKSLDTLAQLSEVPSIQATQQYAQYATTCLLALIRDAVPCEPEMSPTQNEIYFPGEISMSELMLWGDRKRIRHLLSGVVGSLAEVQRQRNRIQDGEDLTAYVSALSSYAKWVHETLITIFRSH